MGILVFDFFAGRAEIFVCLVTMENWIVTESFRSFGLEKDFARANAFKEQRLLAFSWD